MAKRKLSEAALKLQQGFSQGISETPESLPEIFTRLRTPMSERSELTMLMSKLVAEGTVEIIPADDSGKTLPKYRRSTVSHPVRRAG